MPIGMLLSEHADNKLVRIYHLLFVTLFLCLSANIFVTDISGVSLRMVMKFVRTIDLCG